MDVDLEKETILLGGLGFLLLFMSILWYYVFFAIGYFTFLGGYAWPLFALLIVGFAVDTAAVAWKIRGKIVREIMVGGALGVFWAVGLLMLDEFLAVTFLSKILFGWSWVLAAGTGLVVALIAFSLMEFLDYTDVW